MSHSIQSLKDLSDKELIEQHDELAQTTVMGTQYYLSELRHREQVETNQEMGRLTRWIFGFTVVVTIATVINLGLFITQFFNSTPTP